MERCVCVFAFAFLSFFLLVRKEMEVKEELCDGLTRELLEWFLGGCCSHGSCSVRKVGLKC